MNLLTDGVRQNIVHETRLTKNLTLDNISKVYKVHKVRLDCLYFNDQNDRIATFISEYKTDNNISNFDIDDREAYNDLIHTFITESNKKALEETQKNIKLIGQEQAGVVLADGRIVDGNRRFTCLRNIQKETGTTQYMNVVILNHDNTSNAKEIKLLELYLQHGVDRPVDYNPIDRLVGIYNDIVDTQMLTVSEYAKTVNTQERTIAIDVERSKLMMEFLEFINAPKQFHIAKKLNLNDPLKELHTMLKSCGDEDQKENIKSIVFSNFVMQPYGDMTRYMRKIKKIVTQQKHLESFIDEQMDLAVEVCDIICEVSKVDERFINERLHTQEPLKAKFESSTNKFEARSNSSSSKKIPENNLSKSIDLISQIDTNIFKKLTDEEIENILEKIDEIEKQLVDLKGLINV